jgi:hypothetical protein
MNKYFIAKFEMFELTTNKINIVKLTMSEINMAKLTKE